MKNERFSLAILLIVSVGTLLAGAAGNCQSPETPGRGRPQLLACAVRASADASLRGRGHSHGYPIVANPLNGDDLLLGSVDYNCGQESNVGFHLSSDGGSTWKRVECMAAITTKQNNYLALDEPSVGYDRNGTAYIAGVYSNVEEFGGQGLVAVQKSTDGTHWSKPVVALRRSGQTFPYTDSSWQWTRSLRSRWVNSVYVSGVMGRIRVRTRFWFRIPSTAVLPGSRLQLIQCRNTQKKTTLRASRWLRTARST